jgi:hypothetical protein
MTDIREKVAKAIHYGLGGDGWAYTNYGGDELKSKHDELAAAADAAILACGYAEMRKALEDILADVENQRPVYFHKREAARSILERTGDK